MHCPIFQAKVENKLSFLSLQLLKKQDDKHFLLNQMNLHYLIQQILLFHVPKQIWQDTQYQSELIYLFIR